MTLLTRKHKVNLHKSYAPRKGSQTRLTQVLPIGSSKSGQVQDNASDKFTVNVGGKLIKPVELVKLDTTALAQVVKACKQKEWTRPDTFNTFNIFNIFNISPDLATISPVS